LNINDQLLQQRLIGIPDLELNKAIFIIIKQAESTGQHINNDGNKISIDALKGLYNRNKNKAGKNQHDQNDGFKKAQTRQQSKNYRCKKYNTDHGYGNCPAYGKTCKKCNRKNHFAVSCYSKIGKKSKWLLRVNMTVKMMGSVIVFIGS